MVKDSSQRVWLEKSKYHGIGMMSGTSMDGIDVAVVEFGQNATSLPQLLAFETVEYAPALRELLHTLSTKETFVLELVSRANWAMGHAFAEAALKVMAKHGFDPAAIDFIGSHGQTICHHPHAQVLAGFPSRGTCQIGEPAVIASKTGIVTVADFRAADMAVGGQGAPLVPAFDYHFFADPAETRILLNIGGIANFTLLPAGAKMKDVIAFDSGPGNMLLDGAAQHYFGVPFDKDGRIAATGTCHPELLGQLKAHRYFQQSWPKSTGRENFGGAFLKELVRSASQRGLSGKDLLATLTRFTAETICDAIRTCSGGLTISKVWVSGGGRYNQTLLSMLEALLAPAAVMPFDETGLSSDAKEAVCFAYLAAQTLKGLPCNVPAATGAARNVILGKVSFP